jgi:hypothetical protein
MRNFVPIHVYRNLSRPELVRFDASENPPPGYKRELTMYAVNPLVFPPAVQGATLLRFTSLSSPPYHTIHIHEAFSELSDYLSFLRAHDEGAVMASPDKSRTFLYAFLFVRAFGSCLPVRYLNRIGRDNMPFVYTDTVVKNAPYEHGAQYFFYLGNPEPYWSCSSEGCCVPSSDPGQYQTLAACQIHCYNTRLQREVFTSDSQRLLYTLLGDLRGTTTTPAPVRRAAP